MARRNTEPRYEGTVEEILEKKGEGAVEGIKILYNQLKAQVDEEERANSQASRDIKQGQHVINKSLLDVQQEIIKIFIGERMPGRNINPSTLPQTSAIKRAYEKSNFTNGVTDNIKAMTADIPAGDYFDANQLIYRVFLIFVRQSAAKHMIYLFDHPGTSSSPYEQALDQICSMMNEKEIYVDRQARHVWISYQPRDNKRKFDQAKLQVSQMLLGLKNEIPKWVNELQPPH